MIRRARSRRSTQTISQSRRSTQTISQSTGRKCEVNDHCGVCTFARIHRFSHSQWVPSLSALLHADFSDKVLCRRMKKRPCGGGGRNSSDKQLHKVSITLLRTVVQVMMGRLGLAGLCRHGQNSVVRADHIVVDWRSQSVTILWSCTSEYWSVLLCYGVPCFRQVFNTTATTHTWTCFVCNIQFWEYFNSIPSLYPTLHNTFKLMYLFVQWQHLYTALHE